MDCPLKYANAYRVDVECSQTDCAWWMVGRVNQCAILVLSWILSADSADNEIKPFVLAIADNDVPFD